MLKESSLGSQAQGITGRLLGWIPLSANQVTLLAVAFAVAGFYLLVAKEYAFALILFSFSAFCDMLDGVVARAKNQVSARGAFLDGVSDRLVEFFLLFGLMLYPWPLFILPGWMWLVMLLFFGSCMTAFVPAYAHHRGILAKSYPQGILPRTERMIVFMLILLAVAYNQIYPAAIAIVVSTMLAIGTVCERIIYFYLLEEKKEEPKKE